MRKQLNVALVLIGSALILLNFETTATRVPPEKISKRLQERMTKNNVPILIVMKEKADLSLAKTFPSKTERGQFVYDRLREVAKRTQADLVQFLVQRDAQFRSFYISNMIAVDGAAKDLIQEIADRNDVEKVIYNPSVKMEKPRRQVISEPRAAIEKNITQTGAPKVWDTYTRGSGIVVAGQDTGIQWDHPALQAKYRGWDGTNVNHDFNWHDSIHKSITGNSNKCGYDLKTPCDDDQHGTHTMGTMLGSEGEQNKIGMAPDAKFIGCRNMDGGVGTPATYMECFEFFLAPYPVGADAFENGDPSKAPHVVNNSWGCPGSEGCDGDEMVGTLNALSAAGIMIVASAGNEGPGCASIGSQPATVSDYTFSVGAMNHRDGEIADFSSRGPSTLDSQVGPDIVAPGVSIRSAVPIDRYESGWSGTSMASPHVVGLVALMWSAQPKLVGNIEATANLIRKTATPKKSSDNCGGVSGDHVPNNTFGYGNINAFEAVKAAVNWTE